MEESKLKVRPKLSIKYYFLRNTWMLVLAVLFIILTLIFQLSFSASNEDLSGLGNGFMGIIRLLIIIVVPIVYIYQTIKMYLHTRKISYTFYDGFVRYEDEFLNKESKDIRYENISEVEMYQNIWDRFLQTGNIYLKTNVERNAGIIMLYVIEPKQTVDDIKNIISSGR